MTQPKVTGDEGTSLSYDERLVMLHTLGLDRGQEIYRNFFAASPGHRDIPTLDALVERDLMVKETSAISPDFVYRVTAAGKQALLQRTARHD